MTVELSGVAAEATDTAVTKKKVTKPRVAKSDTKPAVSLGTAAGLFGIEPYQIGAKEEYMSDGQLQHFLKIMDAWRADLMAEVDRTVSHMKDESSSMADINDRATQEEEFAIELRTRDRERKLLRKIDQTVKLIEAGDYGYCETCGIEIGLRRLEARPTATQCIDCKTLSEIKERQDKGA